MSKTLTKSFILSAALFFPSFALKADATSEELRRLARDINDESFELRRDVDTLINDAGSNSAVKNRINTLQNLLSELEDSLDQVNQGDLPRCIQDLSNLGFSRTDGANICSQAGGYMNVIPTCIRDLGNLGFARNDGAAKCLSAGGNMTYLPNCTREFINLGFSRVDASDSCVEAGAHGTVVAQCTRDLINIGFNRVDAASNCVTEGRDADEYPTCVRGLINQGFSRVDAARNCH